MCLPGSNRLLRNFKYRNGAGDLPDIVEAIMDANNEDVLQEHAIDANADDHNEMVEWRNDHDEENQQTLVAVTDDNRNDEANNIIGYLENGPANDIDNDQQVQNEETRERNANNVMTWNHDESSNESDGYETAPEDSDDGSESIEEKTVDRTEDNEQIPQEAEMYHNLDTTCNFEIEKM